MQIFELDADCTASVCVNGVLKTKKMHHSHGLL
jgi:hypothetical protein